VSLTVAVGGFKVNSIAGKLPVAEATAPETPVALTKVHVNVELFTVDVNETGKLVSREQTV
jgi:hypothetical protein